jgi:hypothetical protein
LKYANTASDSGIQMRSATVAMRLEPYATREPERRVSVRGAQEPYARLKEPHGC